MNVTNRIADMPLEERPYEKCVKYGAGYLTDAELLAIIIRTGTQGERSLDIARKVLHLEGKTMGLLGIHHSSIEQLMKLKGVGTVKAIQLKCVAELARRFAKAQVSERLSFHEPSKIAEYYMEDLRHAEKEECHALLLDSKCALIRKVHVSTGCINASFLAPREILKEALTWNAACFILMHNHPSGDPQPSREDVAATLRVKECGELMGIPLMDHIVIGDNRYVSLKEAGLLR